MTDIEAMKACTKPSEAEKIPPWAVVSPLDCVFPASVLLYEIKISKSGVKSGSLIAIRGKSYLK